MTICKIKECKDESVNRRGWCGKHYMKWYRHGEADYTRKKRGRTPTSITWMNMKQRCSNPKSPDYDRYGGRGISYDPSWERFDNFLRDMGERPGGMTLDRIDNSGNYNRNNCRWADIATQTNNRSDNRFVTYKGETLTVMQWSRRTGIKYSTMLNRLKSGWTIKEALYKKSQKIGD